MGRVLGRIEYGNNEPNRFFIHDDTSGWSIPPLFVDPDAGWKHYGQGESLALHQAFPQQSKLVHVVRKVLAYGRAFGPDEPIHREPVYGLASSDRLLWPLHDDYGEDSRLLLRADGILHVAREVDGGFFGRYDNPLCKGHWQYREQDQRLSFEDMFGHALVLCPHCLEKLGMNNDV